MRVGGSASLSRSATTDSALSICLVCLVQSLGLSIAFRSTFHFVSPLVVRPKLVRSTTFFTHVSFIFGSTRTAHWHARTRLDCVVTPCRVEVG